MELKKIENQAEWDRWLNEQNAPFTQAWDWGEILIAEGKKVERLAVVDNGKIIAAAQVDFNRALGFNYAFCPKGPVKNFQFPISNFQSNLNDQISKYLKEKDCTFFRFEPAVAPEAEVMIKKTLDVNPRATTILSLDKSEEELLEKMHAKTRYNIRLAEKKSLKISAEKNFDIFWKLMQETAGRDKFRLHGRKHYEVILDSSFSHQLTIFQNDKPVATMVYVSFGKTATYLFGASDYESRPLMAPYLLQSEAIKNAKNEGTMFYDFFGIAPGLDPKHQYAGVTRFKLGFGGEVVEQPGTFDLIISPGGYKIYRFLRYLRRLV
mgnify:CR=1 FL=1